MLVSRSIRASTFLRRLLLNFSDLLQGHFSSELSLLNPLLGALLANAWHARPHVDEVAGRLFLRRTRRLLPRGLHGWRWHLVFLMALVIWRASCQNWSLYSYSIRLRRLVMIQLRLAHLGLADAAHRDLLRRYHRWLVVAMVGRTRHFWTPCEIRAGTETFLLLLQDALFRHVQWAFENGGALIATLAVSKASGWWLTKTR